MSRRLTILLKIFIIYHMIINQKLFKNLARVMDWEFSFNTELFLIQSENGHESQPSGILKRHIVSIIKHYI